MIVYIKHTQFIWPACWKMLYLFWQIASHLKASPLSHQMCHSEVTWDKRFGLSKDFSHPIRLLSNGRFDLGSQRTHQKESLKLLRCASWNVSTNVNRENAVSFEAREQVKQQYPLLVKLTEWKHTGRVTRIFVETKPKLLDGFRMTNYM